MYAGSVDAGGAAMADFSESEGDNADVFEQGGAQEEKYVDQNIVIAEQAESGDAVSAQSTGKMDSLAPGWTKRVSVGKHPPDRTPCSGANDSRICKQAW